MSSSPPPVVTLGSLVVDTASNRITFESELVELSPVAGRLLAALVTNRNRVVSRHELAKMLDLRWERSVDVLVMKIRRALGEASVRTVRGRGWIIDTGVFGAEAAAHA
jgi:DNA-binding response OmpR family regulator